MKWRGASVVFVRSVSFESLNPQVSSLLSRAQSKCLKPLNPILYAANLISYLANWPTMSSHHLPKLAKFLTNSSRSTATSFVLGGAQRSSKLWHSTGSFDNEAEDFSGDLMPEKRETIPQGVDPKRGWNFRGVHKAIICGKVRQTPVQKLLRNGKSLTIFNVGTGGMFDQRNLSNDLPKPAQWHRVVVHNEVLGAYAVQQLTKNSSVYVEGDIELRVYNKGITGEIVKLPEICVRTNGKIRLIRTAAEPIISFEELREGLLD